MTAPVDAITFDFYGTLVYPREGRGRGAVFMDYLREQGFESDPWEHQVLYDVFERHGVEYDPVAPAVDRERYYQRFAERVFRRLNVRVVGGAAGDAALPKEVSPGASQAGDAASELARHGAAHHAANVWKIFGPGCLAVYPDVSETLAALRVYSYPLAIVSNWQCGLRHFCVELGLGDVFDQVLSSADTGYAKPDPRIFVEACRRLGCRPERVLHVGASPVDDVEGALGARLQVVRVDRGVERLAGETSAIRSLNELTTLLGLEGAVS
jgi:HAD superfamily hydrolase (TIGR01549 family)